MRWGHIDVDHIVQSDAKAIVKVLFTNYIEASRRLGVDATFRERVEQMRAKLMKLQIGRRGQLQEWEEDRDSRWDHHRHVMHLFALHPGRQVNPVKTPELARAAETTLRMRGQLSHLERLILPLAFSAGQLLYRQPPPPAGAGRR